ncbi:MAG TPA: adenylate/guanylate cyclase domain-containing protein [Gaiellaceae bacterium]|nr:adenylate/guanylate cyclase domain-containing protein [Gaiellaceae bacterium]
MDAQRTQYARAGELSIAYAVGGEGPVDVIYLTHWFSHVEAWFQLPAAARFLHRLESFARVIRFDLPGFGMSDPVAPDELPTLEEWRDCVRVVLDAAGSQRAVLFAHGAGAAVAIPFAATYPDRTAGLVLHDASARLYQAEDYPFGFPERVRESGIAWWLGIWGTGRQLELTAPALADDPYELEAMGRYERFAASPGVARAFFRLAAEYDVREILPAVRVPTLVLHRAADRYFRAEHGRYLAERIPGARYVELQGEDHFPFYGDMESVVAEIRSFLATLPEPGEADRMLATILVTDIVGSMRRAGELGDRRWRELLDRHDEEVRAELDRFRGQLIRSTGDGILAMFDGAARAVRCAGAIRTALLRHGLDIRAGLHTGEVELRESGPDGIAVHIAARVGELAESGEVLVSQTVKDLTVGADLDFEPRGSHTLKGVPGDWQTYAAVRC